jgi:hypothetical protein
MHKPHSFLIYPAKCGLQPFMINGIKKSKEVIRMDGDDYMSWPCGDEMLFQLEEL